MFEKISQIPLSTLDGVRYRGLAYDGCNFYLTVHCACTILQLDDCFRKSACFETRRAYAALCYDGDEKCFWATADGALSTVYKLNRCMEEIDCLTVCDCKGRRVPITGLSYSCCDHSLVVAFAGEVVRVRTACPEQSETVLIARHEWFLGVLSLCPYLLCYCVEDNKASVRVYSHRGELLYKVPQPCCTEFETAVFWPCVKDFCRCHILVLRTKKGCYPCLCDYVLSCDALCRTLCPCNYALCRNCPCDDPCCDPCADPCGDVLESIALVEAALAHILNAEGEKIQKVVACSDDICEIMAVNESVQKTINKAICLEQLLYCKLDSLGEHCDICASREPCEP